MIYIFDSVLIVLTNAINYYKSEMLEQTQFLYRKNTFKIIMKSKSIKALTLK